MTAISKLEAIEPTVKVLGTISREYSFSIFCFMTFDEATYVQILTSAVLTMEVVT